MKKILLRPLATLGFIISLCTLSPTLSQAEETTSTELTKKLNRVESLAKDQSAWTEAQLHQKLLSGDSIRTGKNSGAQLTFSDGSMLKMSSLTKITVNPLQREIKFSFGKILLKFMRGAQEAKVIAPGSFAATIGTAWVQEIGQGGEVTLHVVEGTVNFTSGGVSQKVKAGETSTALLNQPPSAPQPFNIEEYSKTETLFEGLDLKELLAPQAAIAPTLAPVPEPLPSTAEATPPVVKPEALTEKAPAAEKTAAPENGPTSVKSGVPSGGPGWSFTAMGDGLRGIHANPANLAESPIEADLSQFEVAGSNNAVTLGQMFNLITSGGSPQSKTDIENAVAAQGILNGKVATRLFSGFSVVNFAVTAGTSGVWDMTSITPDAVTLMLGDQQKLVPTLGVARAWNIQGQVTMNQPLSYGISYAQPLNLFAFPVSVGATVKFYSGGLYAYNNFVFQANYDGINPPVITQNSLVSDSANSASGTGIDIGTRVKFSENLYAGLAITDLGGDITWTGTHGVGTVTVNPATGQFTPNYTFSNATFTSPQNTTWRIGAAYIIDLLGNLTLAADYISPRLTAPGLQLGAEKWFGPVALRLGMASDLNNSSNYLFKYGFGIRLGFFNFDFASLSGDKTGALALNTSLSF